MTVGSAVTCLRRGQLGFKCFTRRSWWCKLLEGLLRKNSRVKVITSYLILHFYIPSAAWWLLLASILLVGSCREDTALCRFREFLLFSFPQFPGVSPFLSDNPVRETGGGGKGVAISSFPIHSLALFSHYLEMFLRRAGSLQKENGKLG